MKVLIWFLCILANALIIAIFKTNGILLGGVPTMILFGLMFWTARTLCRKWEKHNGRGDDNGED